jgi:hypothetical protein
MIDLLGFIYDVAKDIKEHYTWKDQEKLVDFSWPEKSGLKAKVEEKGMKMAWCRPDRVASLQLDGWKHIFEFDEKARIRSTLVLKDGLVLMGKPSGA